MLSRLLDNYQSKQDGNLEDDKSENEIYSGYEMLNTIIQTQEEIKAIFDKLKEGN